MSNYRRPHQKPEGQGGMFHFRQNNSGGHFHIDDEAGIGPNVWIEATSPEHANQIAESMGIYFDGVHEGRDCGCCGDRWYPVRDYDASDELEINPKYDFDWHDTVYVHRLDGTLVKHKKNEG